MTKIFNLRLTALFTALILILGLATRAQAQSNSNLTTLDDAYATLAQANHDYKGHRARAMKQIEMAVKELGGSISGHGKGHEPQGTSDAQLKAAQGLLQGITGLQGKAAKHVERALAEINDALDVK
jgi:hypothetical protein